MHAQKYQAKTRLRADATIPQQIGGGDLNSPRPRAPVGRVAANFQPTQSSFRQLSYTINTGIYPSILLRALLGYPKVKEILKEIYYWPKMDEKIERVVRDCIKCLESTVRRKHLTSHFVARSDTTMNHPRHAYGIDFYGVAKGEILTAVDLCTREIQMWWLPDRDQKRVANALISGLIFQRGVPISLRSDNAPELMQGVVRDINAYHCSNYHWRPQPPWKRYMRASQSDARINAQKMHR